MLGLVIGVQLLCAAVNADSLQRPVQDLPDYEISPEPTGAPVTASELDQDIAENRAHAAKAQALADQFANPLDAITDESLRKADFATWGPLQAPAQRLVQDAEFRTAALSVIHYPDFAKFGGIELGTLVVYWISRAWRLRRAATARARFWIRAQTFVFFNGLMFLVVPMICLGAPFAIVARGLSREILRGIGLA